MKFIFSISVIIALSLGLSGCDKEPAVEVETITVYDTVIVSTVDTIYISDDASVTSFIFVRHAEKEASGADPVLTSAGMERAENLAFILSENELDRVYSTDYNRTTQTAGPTATDQGLTITSYGGFDHDLVIDDILENEMGGKVLIVGHSNTTSNFLNALTETSDFADIPEDEFDNLYIVSVKSVGDSKVNQLKY